MAWESRGGLPRYYTRTYRRGPGLKRGRIYLGTGPIAELAWVQDMQRRLRRERNRRRRAEERRSQKARIAEFQAARKTKQSLNSAGDGCSTL